MKQIIGIVILFLLGSSSLFAAIPIQEDLDSKNVQDISSIRNKEVSRKAIKKYKRIAKYAAGMSSGKKSILWIGIAMLVVGLLTVSILGLVATFLIILGGALALGALGFMS